MRGPRGIGKRGWGDVFRLAFLAGGFGAPRFGKGPLWGKGQEERFEGLLLDGTRLLSPPPALRRVGLGFAFLGRFLLGTKVDLSIRHEWNNHQRFHQVHVGGEMIPKDFGRYHQRIFEECVDMVY